MARRPNGSNGLKTNSVFSLWFWKTDFIPSNHCCVCLSVSVTGEVFQAAPRQPALPDTEPSHKVEPSEVNGCRVGYYGADAISHRSSGEQEERLS